MPRRRPLAALYHRVSTVDQDPHLAARELKAAARRYGYQVAIDVRESARGSSNRPGLQRIMDAARKGAIEAVIVWKLDRFGRSALDLLAHLRELEQCRVRFVAVTQGVDIDPAGRGGDATGRLVLTVLAAIAEWERELISERTRLGMAAARRKGTRLGRPPVELPDKRKVEALRKRGLSWAQVAQRLDCSVWAARRAAGRV